MKKAEVNEAAIAMIAETRTSCWDAEGNDAERCLTYIAGIVDFAVRIKELCND